MKISKLCICRAFLPTNETDKYDCHFYFVDMEYIDEVSILEVCKAYGKIYIEKEIYSVLGSAIRESGMCIHIIDNMVYGKKDEKKSRVAFLASSDTHVQAMQQLVKDFEEYVYLVPARHCKDDSAIPALERLGEKYIEIDYKANECEELMKFAPDYIFSATDWTSEYLAVKRIIKATNIKIIALQEGPMDWHFRIGRGERLKVLNHYRNADIVFATGAKTMNYIRPKYFCPTGNPKFAAMGFEELPVKPRVLINCNFTYLETKPAYESSRNEWMSSVLRVCKKVGVDYVISKHPRDFSEWRGEPVINSNAFILKEQILDSSVCISRFSAVLYEALACGRQSIYYNVALEPMATFQDEEEPYIPCIINEEDLEKVLRKHIENYPPKLEEEKASYYLNRHVSKLDGKVKERVLHMMQSICSHEFVVNENFINIVGIEDVRIRRNEQELVLNSNNNKAIVLYGEDARYHKVGIEMAERWADEGQHVFLIVQEYPKAWGENAQYEYHQTIEVIPTRDYKVDFNGAIVESIIAPPGFLKEQQFVSNILNSCLGKEPQIETYECLA